MLSLSEMLNQIPMAYEHLSQGSLQYFEKLWNINSLFRTLMQVLLIGSSYPLRMLLASTDSYSLETSSLLTQMVHVISPS